MTTQVQHTCKRHIRFFIYASDALLTQDDRRHPKRGKQRRLQVSKRLENLFAGNKQDTHNLQKVSMQGTKSSKFPN